MRDFYDAAWPLDRFKARMKIERRASLETGNVTAEPVRNRRRLSSVWEASSKSTEQKRRGMGAGMWAKEEALTREARGGGERAPNRKPARDRPGRLG